ncbi:MAG TPA: preprotein translocase subunit SecG [Ferruginibacter sp.]|nr:preprotein translocase subunit SecG [Ferruginibacter sp.]HCF63404.1 preprotein translocase subunit SecG [Chitinophagaceae bacterium]HML58874.1 preprotein translocase subunit SecG [Ferruginibacter sp.]HRN91138.1 preprotein translocase subunit SecG [Ferruginibacter sp.]HRO05829.1 preprotein translocase subunit SecG [Ferruginibacter sp.]
MLLLFGVLIIIASFILGFIILVQNPKGGGLTGVLGGFSNQLMGVRQSTDIMEKGTWIFAAVIGVLCITSAAFIPKGTNSQNDELLKGVNTRPATSTPATTPANTGTMPATTPAPVTPAP